LLLLIVGQVQKEQPVKAFRAIELRRQPRHVVGRAYDEHIRPIFDTSLVEIDVSPLAMA
jgi:hypothetical protein